MTTDCNTNLFGLTDVEGREVVAGFDGGAITSDAGAPLLGAADRTLGLIDRFAAPFYDARYPELAHSPRAALQACPPARPLSDCAATKRGR